MSNGYFCAFLETIIFAASIAIWISTGAAYFIFVGGAALGAGATMAALEFEQRRQAKKNMVERVNA